ncbi:MAG: hypothetical protein ACRCZI_14325 [Cetobacterium sp.]
MIDVHNIVEEAEETVKEIKLAKKKLYVISSDEDEREKYRMREKCSQCFSHSRVKREG